MWGDERLLAGWRIQSHAGHGYHRLLALDKRCWAVGDFPRCAALLAAQRLPPYPERLVLLVHGLGRSWAAMEPLARALRAHAMAAEAVTYPSTKEDVAGHASRLIRILNHLPGAARVDFVAHSLGAIVVAAALARRREWPTHLVPGRAVFLAPPLQGASMARLCGKLAPMRWLLGACLATLATPAPPVPEEIPLLVIAGGRGNRRGLNPLIRGDDDGTLAVAETRPNRAHDFLLVKAQHSFIMGHRAVAPAVAAFLERFQKKV